MSSRRLEGHTAFDIGWDRSAQELLLGENGNSMDWPIWVRRVGHDPGGIQAFVQRVDLEGQWRGQAQLDNGGHGYSIGVCL